MSHSIPLKDFVHSSLLPLVRHKVAHGEINQFVVFR